MNMRRALLVSFLLIFLASLSQAQGVSCPAVVASPDTTLNCNDCVLLRAQPVSGFTTSNYTVQQIPYNPYPFNAGTPILVNIDDVWGGVLPIGFNFCFYGQSYNQCVVGSNGVVSFDLANANNPFNWAIAQGIPGNPDVLNAISGPFQDIDPSVGGSIFWAQYGAAPCRVFVVSFYQIPMFACNNLIATSQIVLYETTNIIEVYIENNPICATWNAGAAIEGIQDATGTSAVAVTGRNFPNSWAATNDAHAFVPAGTPNYTVQWFEVGNPVAITNLDTITVCPPGNREYYAEVVYTNCDGATVTVRDTATIVASSSSLVVTPQHTDVGCNGAATGTASINVTGNTSPYTILWSNSQTTASISGLAAGTYTVTVTEQAGCASTASVIVTQPSPINLSTTHTDALCNGQATGTATATASGGTGAFSFAWSNGATGASISGLAAGTYTVTATDANGCTATSSATIAEPTPFLVSATATDVVCFGGGDGTATAVVSGGTAPYSYAWSNGSGAPGIAGLLAGNYSVTATDANGCSGSAAVTILEPPVLIADITGDSVLCSYDSVRLGSVVSGGVAPYRYQWTSIPTLANDSTPELVCVNLESRTYVLMVFDQHGCFDRSMRAVTAIQPPQLSFYPERPEACDSITLQLVNTTLPDTYHWDWSFSDGTTSNAYSPLHFFGNGVWSATLTATDSEGCTSTLFQQNIIRVVPTPVASFSSSPDMTLVDYVLLSEANFTFNNTSSWWTQAVNWDFGNGDSAFVGQVQYTVQDSGLFCVRMTAYNEFLCTDDTSRCIRIQQDPFLWVPTGFTPNGDGLNDIFLVTGVELLSAEVSIYDRWGRLIFYSPDKEKGWDGKAMDELAPEGAYVFKIEAVNKLNQKINRGGTVTLIR